MNMTSSEQLTLTSANVAAVFMQCLYTNDEVAGLTGPPGDAAVVQAITSTFGMHPARVAASAPAIAELLRQLPDKFMRHGGGGGSFLEMCQRSDGVQWGEQRQVEELCVLAIASKQGEWCMPRDMWSLFPGGMPYIALAPLAAETEQLS